MATSSTSPRASPYATDNGADAINLSLGTPNRSLLLQAMIDEAISSDTVVAAAAGNASSDGQNTRPPETARQAPRTA